VAHIRSEEEQSVVATIKLAAHISHDLHLARDLSGASVKALVTTVAGLADESASTNLRFIVLWYISMQLFSQAQAIKVAPLMLKAVSQATRTEKKSGLQLEGIRALTRLLVRIARPDLNSSSLLLHGRKAFSRRGDARCVMCILAQARRLTCNACSDIRVLLVQDQFPHKVFLNHSAAGDTELCWWRVVYANLGHQKDSVRQGALRLAERVVPLVAELDPEARARLNEAAVSALMAQDGLLLKLESMLAKKKKGEDDPQQATAAWGFMARFAESKIVKDGHANAFVRVLEHAFAHKTPAVRQEAYKAWFHMACVFDGMGSTLAHPKRLALICRPFRESWPQESPDVRDTIAIVWSHILLLLTRRCSIEKASTFEMAVSDVLKPVLAKADSLTRRMVIDIISGMLHSKRDPNASPSSQVLVGDAPATNLLLRLDFVNKHSRTLFDLLLELGLGDDEEERRKVTQAWVGLVERLAAEESRDTAEALSRATVQYWVENILSSTSSLGSGESKSDRDASMQGRKAAMMHIVSEVCKRHCSERLLFCASTTLQYSTVNVPQTQVKLGSYLVGAVLMATQAEPAIAAPILSSIFARFPSGDHKSYRQVFEVAEHLSKAEGMATDAETSVRLWSEVCSSLNEPRHLHSSPGRLKMQVPILTAVLSQLVRLLPSKAEDGELIEGKYNKELETHWATLFEQVCEMTNARNSAHCLAGAAKVSKEMLKSAAVVEPLGAPSISHLDFVMGLMLDESYLDSAAVSKSKGQGDGPAGHPLQSILELWALVFRSAYKAFEEKKIALKLLKSIISRAVPILVQTVAVGGHHQGLLAVVCGPMLKLLGACSRQGNDSKGISTLGCPGAGGIADEVELVWQKMVETVLKDANHTDLGTLSPLLVSALSNTNSKIQNLAVEYWNSNLSAGVDKSELPVPLQYCLKKLSKRVHIKSLQAADDTKGSGSPTSNDESQMDFNSQSQGPVVLTKSPARLMITQLHGKGSLLRPDSVENTPSRSHAKAPILSADKTEVKSDAPASEEAGDAEYVQIANAKRKLLLTEHQREARKEARTAGALTYSSYTSLEDPESRMQGLEGEMLLMPSDSRTQWDSDKSNWPSAPTCNAAPAAPAGAQPV
jgi:hypothetical protein